MSLNVKPMRREVRGFTAGLIDLNTVGGASAYGNPEKFFGAVASSQSDLNFVNCVLTEQDDNLNGYYFRQSTLIKYHASARLKPYNINHKQNEIIGVIFDSALANDKNEIIDEETDIEWDENGEPFYKGEGKIRVLVAAALYSRVGSPEVVKDIVSKVKAGEKMCVSMECWFTDYDYYLIDPSGNIEIKERNKANAYLDNHMGKILGGKKVCMAFKDDNFLFGGIGQVKKGACEESVILAAALDKNYEEVEGPSIFDITEETVKNFVSHLSPEFKSKLEKELAGTASENPIGESEMSVENKTDAPAIPAPAGSDNKDHLVNVVASQGVEIGGLKTSVAEKDKTISALTEEVNGLKTASEAHATAIAEKDQAIADAEAKATQATLTAKASSYLVRMFKDLGTTSIENEDSYLDTFAKAEFNDEAYAKLIEDIKAKEEEAKQAAASAERKLKVKIYNLKEDASDEEIAEVEKKIASKLQENTAPAPPAKAPEAEGTVDTKAVAAAGDDSRADFIKNARASANEAKITVIDKSTGKKRELGTPVA